MRVLVVASVRLHREALDQALRVQPAVVVTGSVATGEEALARIAADRPDVALLDMAVADGTEACRRIQAAAPSVPVVALWVAEVDVDVIAWAEAGVAGYVGPDASLAELVATVRAAPSGELPCSPRVAAMLLRRVAALEDPSARRDPSTRLTQREHEIVGLVAQGMSNKEISTALDIALPTVKNHVHNILGKTRARRRSDLISAYLVAST